MADLRSADGRGGPVALGEFAVEECKRDAVEIVGQFGIVTWAFVAHEGVGAVDLVPIETQAKLVW